MHVSIIYFGFILQRTWERAKLATTLDCVGRSICLIKFQYAMFLLYNQALIIPLDWYNVYRLMKYEAQTLTRIWTN